MIAVDLFCGAGGTSQGILQALGVGPVVAINHDAEAIQVHAANHPGTLHLCKSVFDVDPFSPNGPDHPPDLLCVSPDCRGFSKAAGKEKKESEIRDLAWVVEHWARAVHPRVIIVENVAEFLDWSPLDEDGKPIKARKGETFRAWVPLAWEAFEDYRLGAVSFSRQEAAILRELVASAIETESCAAESEGRAFDRKEYFRSLFERHGVETQRERAEFVGRLLPGGVRS